MCTNAYSSLKYLGEVPCIDRCTKSTELSAIVNGKSLKDDELLP